MSTSALEWVMLGCLAATGGLCAVILVALLADFASADFTKPTPIVCLYDCADNGPCENDSYCLGPCVCDLDLEECVPE